MELAILALATTSPTGVMAHSRNSLTLGRPMNTEAPKAKKRNITAKQIANLKPAKPGEVRNPEGKNQFTDGRKRVMQQAQAATDKALAILVKQLDSEDQSIAQRAAMALLDRGVGKPVQPTANTDSEGNDIPPPPPMQILPVAAKP